MEKNNLKKREQLGMPYGTACNRLRKAMMFRLAQELGLDVCVRCGERIQTVGEFTMDHIEPWLDNDPALFWDLDNVGFAHHSCNIGAARHTRLPPRQYGEEHKNAKLTDAMVRDIRRRYASSEANGTALAREYGVHYSTVYDVIRRITWTHID